jgi:F-type H+-transporting ATPase subunit alpha
VSKINPVEISTLIKKQIKKYEKELKTDHVGTVISVGDG